jgi:chromosome segregation ATPase
MGPWHIIAALTALCVSSAEKRIASEITANPIRKVVTLLQGMQKKVAAEGMREKELFEKFMCYCKNNGKNLDESIAAADSKITELTDNIAVATEKKEQLQAELKQAQQDRADAKKAMADATALRTKEANEFADFKLASDENIDLYSQL